MAAEGEINGHPAGDVEAHVRSYDRFIFMMKWGAVVCLVIAFVVMTILKA